MSGRTEIALVKYYPILANGVILFFMLMQVFRVNVQSQVSYITGLSLYPAVLLWYQSKRLHFCAWHRVLLGSLVFFAVLQTLWRLGVEYDFYLYIALISTIICIIVATLLYFVHGSIKGTSESIKIHRHGFGLRGVREASSSAKGGVDSCSGTVLL